METETHDNSLERFARQTNAGSLLYRAALQVIQDTSDGFSMRESTRDKLVDAVLAYEGVKKLPTANFDPDRPIDSIE